MLGLEIPPAAIHPTYLPSLPYLTSKGMSDVVHANPSAFSLRIVYFIVGCLTVGFNLVED